MTTLAKVAAKKERAPITKEILIEARDALQANRQKQEQLRAKELNIRNFLADKLHDGEEGAKTITVDGIKVTVSRPLSYSITREEIERMTQEHGDVADEIIRYKPEVKVGEFKKHPELAEYVTVKPGPPTVEFK